MFETEIEEHQGFERDKIKTKTIIDFDTYQPNESLRNEVSVDSENWVRNIYAKINT